MVVGWATEMKNTHKLEGFQKAFTTLNSKGLKHVGHMEGLESAQRFVFNSVM
jgi:hypothetical protein